MGPEPRRQASDAAPLGSDHKDFRYSMRFPFLFSAQTQFESDQTQFEVPVVVVDDLVERREPAVMVEAALVILSMLQGFFFHPTAVAAHRSEAVRLAERAVDLDHRGPAAYCALARAHMMHGDHSAAAPTIRP